METKEHDIVQLMERQQKRKKYHREYMRKTRAKGINKKKPFYAKKWNSKEIEMKYDARTLFDMLNKAREIEVNLKKTHSKEKNRLLKVIENLQVENTDKQNLINKYQLSQEYLIDLISEQTRDIDNHIDNTRKMGRALMAYKKNTN